jgi:hypothetical protein
MPDMQKLEEKLKEIVAQESARPTLDSDYEAGLSDGALQLAQKLLQNFFATT